VTDHMQQQQALVQWLALPLDGDEAKADPQKAQTVRTLLRLAKTKDPLEAAQILLQKESLDISRDPWLSRGPSVRFEFVSLLPQLKDLAADNHGLVDPRDAETLWQHPWRKLSLRGLTGASIPLGELASHAGATLTELDVSGCDVVDVSSLSSCQNLKRLALAKIKMGDAAFVAKLASLESLDLSENNLSRLPCFDACSALRVLKVSGNALADLEPLSRCRSLRSLDVSENSLSDLTPLMSLRGLQTLRFARNSVRSVKPLKDLDGLETVALAMNPVAEDEIEDVLRRRVRIE
jgi:Leucine-rich repeat (LRR) protein